MPITDQRYRTGSHAAVGQSVIDAQALDGHVHSWIMAMLWRDVRAVPCTWCGRTQQQIAALIGRKEHAHDRLPD